MSGRSYQTRLALARSKVEWVATTATNVYASNGQNAEAPHIFHAPIAEDGSAAAWVDGGNPAGMSVNGHSTPAVVFDGSHYVIVASQQDAGLWRYVEP